MMRNGTQGPQNCWCNCDRVNEKVINVWKGVSNIFAIQLLSILSVAILGALNDPILCN